MGHHARTHLIVIVSALCLVALTLFSGAAMGAEVRKPTSFTDLQGATTTPADAFDFSRVYNQNTSASTDAPDADPSINWTTWDAAGSSVYESLSLTVTAGASGFGDVTDSDTWAIYYDNTTGTACDTTGRVLKPSGSENPGVTNYTVALPYTQDLSDIAVCLVGQVNGLPDGSSGGTVTVYDVRTAGTPDTTAPLWRKQQQNSSELVEAGAIELSAQGRDAVNLSHAVLATNETGTWENKTLYGSPQTLYTDGVWDWSNFTWQNGAVSPGTTVGWRVWYNDTAGNWNVTETALFSVLVPYLSLNLTAPPLGVTVAQNTTFYWNVTITCHDGDCGTVTAGVRYNASTQLPDALVPDLSGEPFHTASDGNPQTCSADLSNDRSCWVDWQVNATGDIGTWWSMDVNASSSRGVIAENDTDDVSVEIARDVIGLQLQWTAIDFGSLIVGTTDNPAANNTDGGYNITITESTTTNADIWINGTDLQHDAGQYDIGVSNITWNATDNTPAWSTPLTQLFQPIARNVPPATNITTFYWLDLPLGIQQDVYQGTLEVMANATG